MATYDTTFDIDAPNAQVWSALTDFACCGDWNTLSAVADGRTTRRQHVGDRARARRRGQADKRRREEILTLDQEHRSTWQRNLGAELLFKGFREFTLEPLGSDKTQVRHAESITSLIDGTGPLWWRQSDAPSTCSAAASR